MVALIEQLRTECKALGVRFSPHIGLMSMRTEDSDLCLFAARRVANSLDFDDMNAARLLQAARDYRDQLLIAVLLLFRPPNEIIREALLERLLSPSRFSPQIVCIANSKGSFIATERKIQTHMQVQADADSDETLRWYSYRTLGALDACFSGRADRQVQDWGKEQYDMGAKVFLDWCPRLRTALKELEGYDIYSCSMLDQLAQQSRLLGANTPPHLELMHLRTQGGEICLRAARIVATSPGFDDAQAAALLQSESNYREHLLIAVLLLFRPPSETIREALLRRLMTPSSFSPQIMCIAALKGCLSSPEELRAELRSQSISSADEDLRWQSYQALGALDACVNQVATERMDDYVRGQYELGARTLLGWCPRLRAVLERLG